MVLYRGQFTLKLTLEGRIQRVDKTHNKKHTFGALIHLAQSPQRLKNCTEPAFHYDFMNSIGELMNSIAEFNSETDRLSLVFLCHPTSSTRWPVPAN